MTKLGERTIILQIHSSYVEDFNVSDKIGGAYDHFADSLIISGEKISVFDEIRYLLLVTKLGEHTIILQIHSSYPAKKYRFSAKSGTYC